MAVPLAMAFNRMMVGAGVSWCELVYVLPQEMLVSGRVERK